MSHIEEERDRIAKRLVALADVLDPQERMAPTDGALIAKLGGHVEGVVAGSYETWRRTRGTSLDAFPVGGADVDLAAIRTLSGLLERGSVGRQRRQAVINRTAMGASSAARVLSLRMRAEREGWSRSLGSQSRLRGVSGEVLSPRRSVHNNDCPKPEEPCAHPADCI